MPGGCRTYREPHVSMPLGSTRTAMASLASHKAARSCRLMRRRRRKARHHGQRQRLSRAVERGPSEGRYLVTQPCFTRIVQRRYCTHEQEFSRPTPWLLAHPRSLAADPQGVGPFCRPLRRLAKSVPTIWHHGSLSHYTSTQRLQGRGAGPERRNPARKDVAN